VRLFVKRPFGRQRSLHPADAQPARATLYHATESGRFAGDSGCLASQAGQLGLSAEASDEDRRIGRPATNSPHSALFDADRHATSKPCRLVSSRQQILDPDRTSPDALCSSVEHGVGDRGRYPDTCILAKALHTERIHVLILLIDKNRLEPGNVEGHRDEIVRHKGIDRTTIAWVQHGTLHQRHADTTDHAAGALACRQPRIDDAARPEITVAAAAQPALVPLEIAWRGSEGQRAWVCDGASGCTAPVPSEGQVCPLPPES
jgi:hypothetical protein